MDRGLKNQMVAHLAVFYGGESAKDLVEYGPPIEVTTCQEAVDELLSIPEGCRLREIREHIKGLLAAEEFSGLADIHPAWLVDILSQESPRIIGVILRYLPSNHVRYILNHLPPRLTKALPKIVDSFAVPTPILSVIKRIFERHFIPIRVSRQIKEFTFQNIYYLKAEELEVLIRDLGIQELAMAIEGVEPRTLNVLLNRLTIKEANKLKERISTLKTLNPQLVKEAKYSILEMSFEEMDAPTLLTEIGLNALAKAFTGDDLFTLPLLRQKLSPRLGYILKRYLDLHLANPSTASALRQQLVLDRVHALAKDGAISTNWCRFFTSQEDTSALKFEAPSEDVHSWQSH